METSLNRRNWIKLASLSSALSLSGCKKPEEEEANQENISTPTRDPLCDYLYLDRQWGPEEMWNFLSALNSDRRELVKQSLKDDLSDFDPSAIQKLIYKYTNNIFERPFGDEYTVHYHNDLLRGIAGKIDVGEFTVDVRSSFKLERLILEAALAQIWDKLDTQQRAQVIDDNFKPYLLTEKSTTTDYLGLVGMSGSALIVALSAAINLSGFGFYVALSKTIFATAGFLGITLPFAAYSSTSFSLSLLAGPIGWGIAAILASIGVAILGRAKPQLAIAYVCQLHLIKVEALSSSGLEPELIQAV